MNDLNIGGVLAQIRALGTQASASAKPQAAASEPVSFGAVLKDALDKVNEQGEAVDRLENAFELGDPKVDLSTLVLAGAKAEISSRAVLQVRNRLVSAYQDVMNMPL